MDIRPLRNDLLVEFLSPPEQEGTLWIPDEARLRKDPYTRAKVLALGPDLEEDIDVGDIIWVEGHRSGIKLKPIDVNDNLFLVSETICIAIEDDE